jgi:Fe-S oxidoreductase
VLPSFATKCSTSSRMMKRAHQLSRLTFLLSQFLEKRSSDFELPKLSAKARIRGHCHHKSLMKMTDEESVLGRMGIDWRAPAPGCCGMAGSFGFDENKYDVSMAIGELELLPAVLQAASDSLIIADGFSCREQIAQSTDRQALHLAEVIAMALRGPTIPDGCYPEKQQVDRRQREMESSMKRAGLAVAGIAAGAALLWWLKTRK